MEKPKPVVPPTPRYVANLEGYIRFLEKGIRYRRARLNATLVMDIISTICTVVVVLGFLCLTYIYIHHNAMCSTGSLMSNFGIGDTIMFTLCEPPLMQEDLINPNSWVNPNTISFSL